MFLVTLQSLHFSDIMAASSLHVLQCAFALSTLGFYYYHDSKTFSPKRFMILDWILDGRLSHLQKALFPIFVTLSGMLILVSEVHSLKALSPIFVTLFGILILVRDLHNEKVPSPIFVTLFGIFILVSDSHPQKVSSPIFVTLFGILILVSELHP